MSLRAPPVPSAVEGKVRGNHKLKFWSYDCFTPTGFAKTVRIIRYPLYANKMRILGIDPGLDITGYGLIEKKQGDLSVLEAGIIRTSHKDNLSARLRKIYSEIEDIVRTHKPYICVIEQLYSHYKHRMTAVLMGHARGTVLCCCSQNGVEVKEYPAKTPKRAITGNGNASKLQVQRVVNRTLKLKDTARPLDVTDALALCLTYVYHSDKDLIQ